MSAKNTRGRWEAPGRVVLGRERQLSLADSEKLLPDVARGTIHRDLNLLKSECLNHVVPLGEHHLRLLVSEFVEHYHGERTHQGLANALIVQRAAPANDNGRVQRCRRIGGMLSFLTTEARRDI
jgi:transposase InsO family protein